MEKSIAIYIGSRTDYGLLFPVIDEINNHPDLEYLLITSGIAEDSNYNYFINEIEDDGFDISCQINLPELKGISCINSYNSTIISETNKSLQILEPDYMLIIDDNPGSLAAAQSAFFLNIPVIHLHSRHSCNLKYKEAIRSAINKLSFVHISPDNSYTEYLKREGEGDKEIFTSGSPAIEACEIFSDIKDNKIAEKFSLNLSLPIILYSFEPPFNNLNQALNESKQCLDALKESGYQTIITFPESYPGKEDFIEILTEYKTTSNFQINEIIGYKEYIELIKISSLIIANSTKWDLESNFFKKILLLTDTNNQNYNDYKHIKVIDLSKLSLNKEIENIFSKEELDSSIFNDYTFENTGEKIAEFISKLNIS